MKNTSGKLVSVTLPQSSYKALSDYSKQRHMPVRRMHEELILEAVKRNLWDDMILSSCKTRATQEAEEIYDDLVKDMDEEVKQSDEIRHCYTGMVADYHREITPVEPQVIIVKNDTEELDIEDLLG